MRRRTGAGGRVARGEQLKGFKSLLLPAVWVLGTLVSTGVAQTGGTNGSLWHTDARLANPGSTSVSVNAFLLGTPQTASLSIPPAQTIEIRDTVQSLFGFSGS